LLLISFLLLIICC